MSDEQKDREVVMQVKISLDDSTDAQARAFVGALVGEDIEVALPGEGLWGATVQEATVIDLDA